jgi:hypothetical protein
LIINYGHKRIPRFFFDLRLKDTTTTTFTYFVDIKYNNGFFTFPLFGMVASSTNGIAKPKGRPRPNNFF